MKPICIFDIETDGLLDSVSKIHCLSYKINDNPIRTIYDPKKIRDFFRRDYTFVGHNIVLYDFRVITKLLGVPMPNDFIDTLPLSWYLFPKANEHGLEFWGEYFKYPKVKIEDWKSLTIREYTERCERDVEINWLLFDKQIKLLNKLYDGNPDNIIKYLMFKIYMAKVRHENPIKLDIPFIKENLNKLQSLYKEKKEKLETILPQIPKYGSVTYKNYIELNGQYYTKKDPEFNDLVSKGYEIKEKITVPRIIRYEPSNGNSHDQIKKFLFSIGWKPSWYKKSILKDGSISKTPQIGRENGNSGEICDSIIPLYEDYPELESLESMGVLNHRIGVLKGFLRDQKDGYIISDVAGFTNTLRIRHRGIANLVGLHKPYGDIIRGCFIVDEGQLMCGSDIVSLENSTKEHYMYFYDPEYVKRIRVKGYDSHLSLGVSAGLITEEESEFYKDPKNEKTPEYKIINKKRSTAKTAGFGLLYGAFPPKVAESTKLPLEEAQKIFDGYWELNKSVKQAAESFKIKKVNNQDWVQNPISGFWISLRKIKDVFNTVNQS